MLAQDYNQQPPAQELVARDLHDQEWHFRHIYRGTILFRTDSFHGRSVQAAVLSLQIRCQESERSAAGPHFGREILVHFIDWLYFDMLHG